MNASLARVVVALLFCAASTHAAPVKKPAKAPVKPPSRAKAELLRSAAAYKKLGNFTLTSLEVSKEPGHTWDMRYTARFGTGGRKGIWGGERNPAKQGEGFQVAALFDGKTVTTSMNGRPERRRTLAELKKDPEDIDQLMSYSMALGFLNDTILQKDAKHPKMAQSKPKFVYRDLPGGKFQIETWFKQQRGGVWVDIYTRVLLGPERYIELVESRGSHGKKQIVSNRATVSRPRVLTEENPFDWASFAPPTNSKFVISPESRTVFDRASKLYGGLKTISLELKTETTTGSDAPKTETGSIAWERRGLLRYQHNPGDRLFVSDHTALWLQEDGVFVQKVPLEAKPKVEDTLQVLIAEPQRMDEFGGVTEFLVEMLRGGKNLFTGFNSYTALQVGVLPIETIDATPCDVVKMKATLRSVRDSPEAKVEGTFWFAQDDGRLVRFLTRLPEDDGTITVSDTRLSEQRFDVEFSKESWKAGLLGK